MKLINDVKIIFSNYENDLKKVKSNYKKHWSKNYSLTKWLWKYKWLRINILPNNYRNIYDYLRDFPKECEKYEPRRSDDYFLLKYKKYIPHGHYGFSIGTPIYPVWNEIIDKVLDLCISVDSQFQICQVKLKWGRIDFNCYSNIIEDMIEIDKLFMNNLYDNYLIY
jgi:hypothetical protein